MIDLLANEAPAGSGYLTQTWALLTDPAHMTVEFIFTLAENLIVVAFGYALGKKALRKQHQILDEEHGFTHDD